MEQDQRGAAPGLAVMDLSRGSVDEAPAITSTDNATFTGAEVTNPNLSASSIIQGLTFSTATTSGYTISANPTFTRKLSLWFIAYSPL